MTVSYTHLDVYKRQVTGFGGFITMPVAIPANIGSVIYVQMRMIACTAYMADYDLNSDQTQTFVYACLAGVAVNSLLKQAGIKFGVKFANGVIKKIPGKVLTKINQKVGFRFITKFGSKGIVNLGKMLPGVGAIVGGGLDLVETKDVYKRQTNMRSVGVMGDERTYDYAVALRAVTTTDFMTAESAEIPWEVIGKTTSRIVNEVKHVNRVMYDCTGKPPATIEWE